MLYQKKLTWLLAAATLVGVLAAAALGRGLWRGRAAVIVLVAGLGSWFIVSAAVHRRYASVLREAAAKLGLEFLAKRSDESRVPFLGDMRKKAESDVFRWKVDGKYPALAGLFGEFTVAVRVPAGVDFDAAAPDSTRIAAYHPSKISGLTVYDRLHLRKAPKGRAVDFSDDPVFDARFLVMAHRPEEARAILTPAVRTELGRAGDTGFRGIEVNRYGVFLHEEGKIASSALVESRVRLVTFLALAVKEAAGARAEKA